ncbi:hypothetical protein RNI52_06725 [Labrys neptuniae]|uniref:hypothetical protein n=1 Tax=Labrys neptuniae TaxID=376174 RepID=UPI0028900ED9|nr:hypothetical protein [Labrys neptuniae]MDT3377015.1 hypothetical protein [Labrys neptuniae]
MLDRSKADHPAGRQATNARQQASRVNRGPIMQNLHNWNVAVTGVRGMMAKWGRFSE